MSNRLKKLPSLIFLILIINFSCNSEKDTVVLSKFKTKIPIIFENEVILKGQLDPRSIYLMDSVLVLRSKGLDNYLFSIIDTSNYKELARFGQQGKGAFEIGAIGCVDKINNDSLLVSDFTDFEVHLYSVKDILKGSKEPINVFHTKNKDGGLLCTSLTLIDSNRILGTGIHADGRYAVYNESGMVEDYYVKYPELNIPTENPLSQAMAFQSVVTKQPSGNLIASLSQGIIDIVEYDQRTGVNLKKRLEFFRDEMKSTGDIEMSGVVYPTIATSIKSMIGFEDVHFQCTNTSIYSLFSTRLAEEFVRHHARRLLSDLVVFDWNGDPKYHYSLNKEVYGFSVSQDNDLVYFLAYNEDGETVILKAQLKGDMM